MGKRKTSRGGGGQMLLDSLLKPRRSARQANLKSSGFKSQLSAKDDKTTAFVLEPAEAEITTTASTADKPKSSNLPKNKSKAKTVQETKIKLNLNEEEQLELLKNFDLSQAYGPCRGISRRARYLRALHFMLQPQVSKTILDALDLHEGDLCFQNCIWDQHQFLMTR